MKTRFLSLITLLCFASPSFAAVTSTITDGVLKVVSNSASDHVVVKPDSVNDEPVEAYTSLVVELGAGNDRLVVDGLTLDGDVTISGGAGQDAFTLKNINCRSIKGTVGYFPPAKSGINQTAEAFYFTNVHCSGNIQLSARGRISFTDVSGDILSLMNASGIRGVGLDNSETTCEGIKAQQLFCTFGRGNDTCALSNCEISDRLMIFMNLGDDTLTRENVTAGATTIF